MQFDEQIRLIHAANETDAIEKAGIIGKKEESTFTKNKQPLVQWIFINVCEVFCINTTLDGGEIVSTVREVSSPAQYIKLVNDKAGQLRQTAINRSFNLN